MSIKNARCQPSTPMQSFVSIRCTPFMEIDDKEREIVQRYEIFGRDWDKEVEVGHGHGHGQRGSNIEEKKWIKILGQEKHINGGEQAHELSLIVFDMCIFMCLLALHKLSNLICMLVWCMLVIELEWWYITSMHRMVARHLVCFSSITSTLLLMLMSWGI